MTKTKVAQGEVLKKGAPAKYKPEMCETILEVAEQGGHVAQMCVALGIKSRDTFYRWLNEYPEFKEAYEQSRLASQAFYENILLAGALGKIDKFNFNSIAMVMNNKFPDDYRRSATGSNTEVTIGQINSIEKLDNKALDQKIKQLQKKLGLSGDIEPETE